MEFADALVVDKDMRGRRAADDAIGVFDRPLATNAIRGTDEQHERRRSLSGLREAQLERIALQDTGFV